LLESFDLLDVSSKLKSLSLEIVEFSLVLVHEVLSPVSWSVLNN
jgi:hypothetical protein